jgi:transposase
MRSICASVPGHKTDIKDAEWIADLLQHGLLKASFIPSQDQRDLRDLTRYRTTLIQERTRLSNRLHKLLEEANLKLSSVISELLGKSGRLILHALANGETDPEKLADLAVPRLAQKRAALVQALQGRIRDHHRFLLRELLDAIEYHDRAIARLDQSIGEHVRPFEETIQRLDKITGVGRGCLEILFAEVGSDVTPFPDAAHLGNACRAVPRQ